ncbi:unnamed protein product [Clonostachys rosea f. rosea IK726]|uniref:Uncharacterized protein n=1 Tax=Clonostachys rosea f. rosea IK726 TaxID=1349383 RepID=A0ACA9U5A7_BIOOC|nr:unnamed protein product [Clonostachys rosea f. rosea IK726]
MPSDALKDLAKHLLRVFLHHISVAWISFTKSHLPMAFTLSLKLARSLAATCQLNLFIHLLSPWVLQALEQLAQETLLPFRLWHLAVLLGGGHVEEQISLDEDLLGLVEENNLFVCVTSTYS